MAAGRFVVPPYFPARNRENQLLAGALLYVYENNTTTKVLIYTDEALTVPASNPVVANASGQFPATYAEAGTEASPVLYSVSITTATGASPGNPFNFDNYRPSVDWETAAVALAEAAADDAEASADDAAADAEQTSADLAAIEAIIASGSDAPFIAGKLDRDGNNIGIYGPTLLSNIGAASSALLAASGGSNLIGYLPSGGVAETVQAALRRTIYTDQYDTIQEALDAIPSAGGVLEFPRGATISLTATVAISGKTRITLRGNGCKIQCGATRLSRGYFEIYNSSDIVFEGFNFDGSHSSMPVYTRDDYNAGEVLYNTPIVCDGLKSGSTPWSNVTVRDCYFSGIYTNGVWAYTGNDITIDNCEMNAPVGNQTFGGGTLGAQQYSFVYYQTVNGNINVVGSTFRGATTTNAAVAIAGIFLSGCNGQGQITRNRFEYVGRNNVGDHRLGVVDMYGNVTNIDVFDNTAVNCLASFARVSAASKVAIHTNRVSFNANTDNTEYAIGVFGNTGFAGRGVEDISIFNNVIDDPSNRHPRTISVYSYDWGRPSLRIKVNDNTFLGGNICIAVGGPYRSVDLSKNVFLGSLQAMQITDTPPGVTMTSVYGTEANSYYDRMYIRHTDYYNNSATSKTAIQFELNDAAITAFVGLFVIENNNLRSDSTSGFGIIAQMTSATRSNTRVVIRDNVTNGFASGIYLRDNGEVVMQGNRLVGWGTRPIEADGSRTAQLYQNNMLASGTLYGEATLVAGTVTIANTEFRTGDRILISRKTPGGTVGDLSLGTLNPGVSQIVNSASATDTSVITYQIMH